MQPVRLVTFDIFGTLLDWQAYVEQVFPGRYTNFLAASAAKQVPGAAIFPYRDLLYDVGSDLAGSRAHSREELNFFAEGLGCARPFSDSGALPHLAQMTMLGCISNCDLRHLLDVQRTLGTVFDTAITAEDLRAYKPHAAAWDAAFETVTRRLGFDKREWLHVSAFADFDLIPAKERGVRTCYIPRPGGSDAASITDVADMVVSDLWQLADQIAAAQGSPIRYSVRVTARTPEIAADFLHWMRYEHGPDLLQVRCCQRFQVLQMSETEMVCEYLFTNRAGLEQYYRGPAERLRAKGQERYKEGELRFERTESELCFGASQRSRYDFPGQRSLA